METCGLLAALSYLTLSLSNNPLAIWNRLTHTTLLCFLWLPVCVSLFLAPTTNPPPPFPPSGAKPSAQLLLFSWGCIILALTNYRSMARRAIKRLCAGGAGKKERMKKRQQGMEAGNREDGRVRAVAGEEKKLAFTFFFSFLCLLTV